MRDPLRRSKFNAAMTRKTCPNCSAQAGRFVYKALKAFGERVIDGAFIPQSWCSPCRQEGR